MSRPPIMIFDLKPEQNVWKITIRMVDVLNIMEHNGQQHLEAIIQDAKDNQTYMVYNGEALLNDMPLNMCDNKYKLF
ncbi:hypothetical protein RYX36_006301 [Vicia faba]